MKVVFLGPLQVVVVMVVRVEGFLVLSPAPVAVRWWWVVGRTFLDVGMCCCR